MGQVDEKTCIHQQRHLLAVLGDARLVAQLGILGLPARAQPHAVRVVLLHVGSRAHIHVSHRAIDDDCITWIDNARRVLDMPDGRDPKRARHDRDVRGGATFFEHKAAQVLAVVVEQRGRAHRARHQDRVVGKLLARRRVIAADQLAHQPVRQIVEIVQALAQIGVSLAQHAGAVVGLDALHGGLGGEAGLHRLVHLVGPAAVVGEHAIGFQHLAVLSGVRHIAPLQHHVEVGAQRVERRIDALQLLLRIIGDQLGDDDARLVQHHVAEPNAV